MTNTPPTSSATAPLPPRLDEETFEARLHAAQKQLQEAQYKDAVDALSALVEHEYVAACTHSLISQARN